MGQKFVYGDYESIKKLQTDIAAKDQRIAELEEAIHWYSDAADRDAVVMGKEQDELNAREAYLSLQHLRRVVREAHAKSLFGQDIDAALAAWQEARAK